MRRDAYRTPTRISWEQMRQRCRDVNCKDWPRYGGRGITVCARWMAFAAFLEDMGTRPAGMSIDRIDVNGNYEPSNCRWATMKQQQRNRRSNVLITFDGHTRTIAEWSEHVDLERKTIEWRIRTGWTAARALTTASLIPRKNRGL